MTYASRKARRYADALYDLASERGDLDQVTAELGSLAELLAEQDDLQAVLAHRQIPLERKLELVSQVLAPEQPPEAEAPVEISELTRNFVRLLIENQRTELVAEIVAALRQRIDQRDGVVRATVTTAVSLLKAERDMIESRLKSLTGAQRIELDSRVTKKILGGVIIHIGDHVIDASVRTYLDTMRDRLRRVRVSELANDDFLQLDLDRIRSEAAGSAGG